ncbi:MAG: hypothetical protein MJZ06_08540 [Bacteroidaceae bacterium]|nr:hypothetical protein [Bacteroidaceae bacterium]
MKKINLALAATLALACSLFSSCKEEDDLSVSMDKFKNGITVIQGIDGKDYEVVDMGFPSGTMWATCNIGASKPHENGKYFAWGETQEKSCYDWISYVHRVGDGNEPFDFTKYVQEPNKGLRKMVDEKTALDSIDDAATILLGAKWHTPRKSDVTELLFRTTHKLCKLNGVLGYMLTSTEKGYEDRSIFFPLSGKIDMQVNNFEGKYGFYWINQLYASKTDQAMVLWMDNKDGFENVAQQFLDRCVGLPIRAVTKQ